MKPKYHMLIFFSLAMLHSMAANFAHPITPTLIVNLQLPNYMFGLAFASMAFTNFLFSPFWGKMRDFFSARTLLLIGSIGYGFGQYAFSVAQTELSIVLARCLSGFFVGAIGVSTLIYIAETSPTDQTGQNLAKFSITQAIGGALGFFIGGAVGVYSIRITFLLQFFTLVTCGILFFIFLKDTEKKTMPAFKTGHFIKEINPLKSFLDCKFFMTPSFAVTFLVVTLAGLGTNAFDQNFNYYLKAQFGFSSIYNGVLKAVTGIITLVVVGTVCMWIMKQKSIKKATGIILACCGISIALMLAADSLLPFFAFGILFYSFNAMYTPLLQECMAREATDKNRNLVMGFYNATRSLGMIGGALLAGFIYNYGPRIPFFLSIGCFGLAALAMIWVAYRYEKTSEYL
ncbi:MFS transporter [Clostridiales bacterium COT073_COT-073]|nr:MFS transporter [Clostridiales bacterium COT073_COT-073]